MTVSTHVIERAAVLGDHVKLLAQCRERAAVHGVGVGGTVYIGARSVNSRMNHKSGLVEQLVRARFGDLDDGMVVDEDEVTGLDQAEVLSL